MQGYQNWSDLVVVLNYSFWEWRIQYRRHIYKITDHLHVQEKALNSRCLHYKQGSTFDNPIYKKITVTKCILYISLYKPTFVWIQVLQALKINPI